jgi:diacylglycerol kinase (ATP)
VNRVGLIWNQKSHRNQGAGRGAVPDNVLEVVPEDPAQLFPALRRFAAEGVDLVVIDGGDGTVREVITRLPEAYGERMPRLAVVPNGKTNALAIDIGTPLGTTLEQLLGSANAGNPVKRRQCLEIVRPGQAMPERRGFLLGLGAFVRGTELAQKNHGLGLFDNAAIGVTMFGAAASTLLGGPSNPWRRGEPMSLSMAGAAESVWFLVLASTLKRLPLGVKPFGAPREGLKVLAIAAPPQRFARALPILLRGDTARWFVESGYHRADLPTFDVTLDGSYVLDGEIYEGGGFSVREGPELEFVIP